ncbi:hypothetical protein Nepgr_000054 [Nepenthes gracilis]|uniref:Uncharacterized protein n=1 Tax=Nepenthes gracilis TaxID=150966 RepID=A0AAD3P1G5_NEPGR|nr:hypothetical protein Nepgr_000054 [Nepenthes gracilis]
MTQEGCCPEKVKMNFSGGFFGEDFGLGEVQGYCRRSAFRSEILKDFLAGAKSGRSKEARSHHQDLPTVWQRNGEDTSLNHILHHYLRVCDLIHKLLEKVEMFCKISPIFILEVYESLTRMPILRVFLP